MGKEAKKLVIFDLDGTLIDSVPDLASSVNRALEELGRESFPEETVREWVGNGAQTLIRCALGLQESDGGDLFKEALALFLDHYSKNLTEKTILYPGVEETLERVASCGLKMAVATNKPEPFVKPILEHFTILHRFDQIVGAETVPRKKPHPDPLLHICKNLGIEPSETLMVGDSKNDILAAKSAGIGSVAVSWGYNYGEDIALYAPDHIIESLEELPKLAGAADGG